MPKLPKPIADTVYSLERRLIGALLLIAACIAALQIASHDRGLELAAGSGELQEAASNAQRARQLADLVSEFRIAANIHLGRDTSGTLSQSDQLTDIAIAIGEQVNSLRLAGMPLYELEAGMMSFEDLDQHVASIRAAPQAVGGGEAELAAIGARNRDMGELAALIADNAARIEADRFAAVQRSAADWSWFVGATGAAMSIIIGLILLDLLGNILPAMRRLNSILKRLAAGDLDVAIEDFRLRELRVLSEPLETFRRNALAVKNLAFTDSATGLPNRRAMVEAVSGQLAGASARGAGRMLLAVADIDRFKHVNDDFGHAAGDRLVMLIGQRMQQLLGPRGIVARVGGDEFALCIPLDGTDSSGEVASELVAAMREPIAMGSYSVAITMSAGFMELGPRDAGQNVNLLLDRADLALYAAKKDGRNRAAAFLPAMETDRDLDRTLERDLARAVFNNQLRMVYQPIHAVGDETREVEALVRWDHPGLGAISPERFIPVAERSGQMVELGAWIIERSLADLGTWRGITLSLNLSPLQLQQDGFCSFLLGACARHRIAPARLILEVTESLSIERNTRALLTLDLLRNAGFRIALDDFGTGYSSLSMLKTFRFDRLKLDRSLINDLATDPTAKAVFDAAVTMALRVGAQVVAEGISESDLVEPVSLSGCTHLQGFHFSKPIAAHEVERYFEAVELQQNGATTAPASGAAAAARRPRVA